MRSVGPSLVLAAAVVWCSACSHNWNHPEDDAGQQEDGSFPTEAQVPGLDPDADSAVDAGTSPDTGPGIDADTHADTGTPLDAANDAQPPADAQALNDGGDAQADGMSPVDGAGPTNDATPPPACPAQPNCPAAYPCVPNAGGFTCRGQRADWPLPLRKAGQSASAQQFVVSSTTLLDSVTGLMWERLERNVFVTFAEATTYCDALELQGFTDFRVPTVMEIATLLGAESAPELDGALWGTNWPDEHWSSSPDRNEPSKNWNMGLNDGTIWSIELTNPRLVRCVRTHEQRYAGTNATRMSTNAAGVTTDHATGLEWQQSVQSADSDSIFSVAESHCAGLELDGKSDWRLPTFLELFTTFDPGQTGPTTLVSPLLGPTGDQDCYWSSTLSSFTATWRFIAFPGGSGFPYDLTKADATCAARCVRK